MDKDFSLLFKDLCCSRCKEDFDENSVEIIREEPRLLVIKLTCQHCGKDFGYSFLGLNNLKVEKREDLILEKNNRPNISSDDVIDAHIFIKNLDETWQKYLSKIEEN